MANDRKKLSNFNFLFAMVLFVFAAGCDNPSAAIKVLTQDAGLLDQGGAMLIAQDGPAEVADQTLDAPVDVQSSQGDAPALQIDVRSDVGAAADPLYFDKTELSFLAPCEHEEHAVTLRNRGPGASGRLRAMLEGDGAKSFSVLSDACSNKILEPGTACALVISYDSFDSGRSAALIVTSGSGDSARLPFKTSRLNHLDIMQLSHGLANFGPIKRGTTSASQSIEIVSSGDGELNLPSIGIVRTTTNAFAIVRNDCPMILRKGGKCRVDLVFQPMVVSAQTATFEVVVTWATPSRGCTVTASALLEGTGI